jgi:tRNA pseudouridine55 synthase
MSEQQNGIIVLNKPAGLSSARCVSRIKRLGQKKIGHAGTLDPMATGVLIILLGQATKLASYLMAGGEKIYHATARLGLTTDTWDAEGKIIAEAPWEQTNETDVLKIISDWHGKIEQAVPPVSAAKHHGQPLYKLFRAGKEMPAKVKSIHISRAEVLKVELPFVSFRVACSSGSYIRSLAHSLGTRLGCGAMLSKLDREYSHPFDLSMAHSLDALLADPERLPDYVMPITAALPGWKQIMLTADQTARLRNGNLIAANAAQKENLPARAVLVDEHNIALALAELAGSQTNPCWKIMRGLWQ